MRPSDCRTNNGSKAEEQYLSRVSIFRSQSKRCSISVHVNKPIRAPKKAANEKYYYKTKHLIKHLSSHVLMMDTVDMLVQPFGMQNPVSPIEYKVLKDEVEYYLR
jgi:hypothetical protein